jgi:hypothetical protein
MLKFGVLIARIAPREGVDFVIRLILQLQWQQAKASELNAPL